MIRPFLLLPALCLALPTATVLAQGTLAFWNNSTGLWSEAGRWSSNPVFPNGPDFGAVINGGNVTLDGDYSVQFFGMGGGALVSSGNRTLTNNAGFTFLTGSLGNGVAANAVTVVANGGISLLSGAQNGTPGTAGNASINAATLINAAGSTASQTNTDNPFNLGSGAVVQNDGLWLARTSNGLLNLGGAPSTFRNLGTFRRDQGTGAYIVGINGGIQFVNAGAFDLQTGVVVINAGGSASGSFAIASGARLEFSSDYTFQAGATVSGAGELRFGSNGVRSATSSLSFPVATLRQDSGTLLVAQGETLALGGAFEWRTGTLGNALAANSGTLRVDGGVTFGPSGGQTVNFATLLVPAGAAAVQSNASDFVRLANNGQIRNEGAYYARVDSGIVNNGGGNVGFVNLGTFVRDTSSGSFVVGINGGVTFQNSGSVQVQTGTLELRAGGSSTGAFDVAGGATLAVNTDYTFAAGTSITGAGRVDWSSGSQLFPASLTLAVAQPRLVSGFFLVAQGQTVTTNGAFAWQTGTLGNGQATNSGTLRVDGGVTFGPGGGQTINFATLHVPAGASARQQNASDFVRLANNGQIRNDGAYLAQTDNGLLNAGGGGVAFLNNGTFVRDTGAGVFAVGVNGGILFQNAGSVQVQTGTLELRAGGSSTGAFDLASGTTLALTNDYTFAAGTSITGAGRVDWSGGSQSFPASLTLAVAQPRLVSGTLLVAQGQTVTTNGAFEWRSGSLGNGVATNSGTLRVNGGVTFGPGGGQTINQATLHVPAGASAFQVNASDFVRLANNGQIRNDGAYLARTDNGLLNGGGGSIAFVNNGLFQRDTATGTFVVGVNGGPPFTNAGTVRVETGNLQFNGGGSSTGALEVLAGAQLEFNADFLFDQGTTATGAGRLQWSNGQLRFPSSLSLAIAQVRWSAGNVLLGQGSTLNLDGRLDWVGGSQLGNGLAANAGTLRAAGGLMLGPGGGQTLNNATLHLPAGAVAIQANASDFLRLGNGAVLRIDGTYYARTDNGIVNNGGATSTLLNQGSFIRDTGTGVFDTALGGGPSFVNAGAVQALTGTLRFSGGGSSTGSFNAAAGAVLEFTNSYTFAAGTTATGAGTLRLAGGPLSIPASLALGIATVQQQGGGVVSVASGQTLALSGLHEWTGASLVGGGTLLAGGGASLRNSQSIANATYAVPAGATATIEATSDGQLNLSSGARLTNAGVLRVRSNGLVIHGGGGGTFANTGLLQREVGTGTFTFTAGLAFDNPGSTVAGSGTLRIDASIAQLTAGTLTGGTWQVNDGATLEGSGFAGGILANAGVIRLFGPGSVFNALAPLAANSGTLRFEARNFTTAGAFLNSGRLELANGSVFTVPNGAQLTNTSTGVLTGQGTIASSLFNAGRVEARGAGTTLVLTGEVTNNGLFVAAAGGTINAVNTTFVNNGVLDRSTGTILLPAGFIDNGVTVDSSQVRIRSAVKTGNTVTLSVDSFSGHSYQLKRSLDLAGDVFVNLGAPQPGSTGSQLIFTDNNASGAKGFYRVVVD
ncbi:MAG: hypothetical protein JSR82_15935 [Verrucomicrobia bacterium]|nr:hypothetical protein [Verrucomicrobiota bacterium]